MEDRKTSFTAEDQAALKEQIAISVEFRDWNSAERLASTYLKLRAVFDEPTMANYTVNVTNVAEAVERLDGYRFIGNASVDAGPKKAGIFLQEDQ